MRLSTFFGSIQILATGLIAGIFIAIWRTEPARISLEPSTFVQYQQAVHFVFGQMMPPLVITAILAGVVWLFLLRKQLRSAAFLLAAVATAASLAAFVSTVVVNFPLNDLLLTWNAASPPANVKELWLPWEHAHVIRTVMYLIAFAAAIAANGISRKEG